MPTISIYSITHRESGKRYIGKSVNTESRWYAHRNSIINPVFDPKKVNRLLWKDVQKFGLSAFDFEMLEVFQSVDDLLLADREVFWIDHFDACNRKNGYNLRRDSSSMSTVHPETRELHRLNGLGEKNPNFGNRWSDEQKEAMRLNRLSRYESYQTEQYRKKQSDSSKRRCEDKDAMKAIGEKVRKSLLQFNFVQMNEDFSIVCIWPDMRTLVARTGFAKQCVYSVCDGYKQRYRGFRWAKIRKEIIDHLLVLAP